MGDISSILYEDQSFMSCLNDDQDLILKKLNMETVNQEI